MVTVGAVSITSFARGRACRLLLLCVLPVIFGAPPVNAQDIEESLEQAIEAVIDDSGEEATRTVEELSFRVLRPLNVNTATADELAAIPALTPLTALKIILHRNTHGPFASYDSLRNVEGVTEDAWREARPFLMVGDNTPPSPSRAGKVELVQRIGRRTTSSSDATHAYLGGPERMYTRLSLYGARHVSANLTLDKDPGEAFRWHPATQTYGYDFLSAHVALRDVGRIRMLVAGDFTANFGQGLVLSSGSVFGKGGNPLRPAAHRDGGLRPYRSSDEFHFFRGVGTTVALTPSLTATLFGSHRRLDGSVEDGCGVESDARCVTRLVTDGLHRSEGELTRKGVQGTTVMGGALEYRNASVRLGATGYRNRFSMPVTAGDAPYERYDLVGRRVSALGIYGQVYVHDLLVFGEAAYSPKGSLGAIGGLLVQVSERAQATILVRHYPASFVDLYGNGFGERSGTTRNESGFYMGVRLTPHRRWTVEGYFDQYRFPWLRFGVHRPASGYEALARIEYRPRARLNLNLQGHTETTEQSLIVPDLYGRLLRSVGPETRQYLRAQATYSIGELVRLRTRLEGAQVRTPENDERGRLAYQDVRWQPVRWLRLDGRFTYYDTDGYASRLYAYENDVLYAFAGPALSGRGLRYYALASAELLSGLTVQFKYGHTRAVRREKSEPTPSSGRDVNVLLRLSL